MLGGQKPENQLCTHDELLDSRRYDLGHPKETVKSEGSKERGDAYTPIEKSSRPRHLRERKLKRTSGEEPELRLSFSQENSEEVADARRQPDGPQLRRAHSDRLRGKREDAARV